jgi:hypothetical protein
LKSEEIMTPTEQLQTKILEFQERLLSASPEMPIYLREIRTQLQNQPELLHILKDEDIASIVQGCSKQAGVVLATETLKKTKARIKKTGVTLQDLGL